MGQILSNRPAQLFYKYLCIYWLCCIFASAEDTIRQQLPPGWDNPWNRNLEYWLNSNNECSKQCEFGVLLEEPCKCICKSGWQGGECDVKCIDTITEKKCRSYRNLCEETRYRAWLRANCPATCQFCEKHGPSSEGFVCGIRCSLPGGVLNETTCECDCYQGWTGDYCQDRCFDTNERCPLWTARQCDNSQVLRNCPVMCGTCVEFGPGSPGFVCLLDCVNGGTIIMNDSECRCECPPGWEGDQCEVLCDNHYPLCEPPGPNEPKRGSYNVGMCARFKFVMLKCRKLCSTCQAIGPGSPNFECTLSCANGGQLINNATDCYCICTPEWKGITCSEPCGDIRSKCSNIIYACTHPSYVGYMKNKCSKTCGYCAPVMDFGDNFIAHGETPRSSDAMALLRHPGDIVQYGAGIEVAILMDASGSTGLPTYYVTSQILIDYLSHLEYQADGGIRIAVVPFSASVPITLNLFDSDSIPRVLRKLGNAPFEGTRSEINGALRALKKKIFVHTRWQARCILIILSDGLFTGDEPFETATQLRSEGVEIYAFSMGDRYIEANLEKLAGDKEHIGVLRSVKDLPNIY